MSFANLFHFIRLKISNCVDDSQEDVSSTGDINKQGHNYTSKSTKNWSDFIYTCEGSTAKCKVTCTECKQTADATVTASTFTNKTDRTCTAGETGNVTFTAKIKNPRTKDTSATTLVGTSETYKTTKVACATHPARGHNYVKESATDTYLKDKATCTKKAKYYYKCDWCSEKGTETYEYGNPLGHNYTDSTNYINDNYKASDATCSVKAQYWYACSRCGDSAKGKTSGTGNPNKTFGYGNYRAHIWSNKTNPEVAYTAKTCQEYNQYYYRCSYADCGVSAKNIDSSKKFNSGTGSHSYTETAKEAKYLKSAGTCTTEAVYYHKCKWCSEKGATTYKGDKDSNNHAYHNGNYNYEWETDGNRININDDDKWYSYDVMIANLKTRLKNKVASKASLGFSSSDSRITTLVKGSYEEFKDNPTITIKNKEYYWPGDTSSLNVYWEKIHLKQGVYVTSDGKYTLSYYANIMRKTNSALDGFDGDKYHVSSAKLTIAHRKCKGCNSKF